jgi:hypothetical protein
MRARSVKLLVALVLLGSSLAACGSSGTAAVASVATTSSTAADAAPTTAVAIVAGNDNSHGGGSGGGGGKNGGGSASGSGTTGTADVIKVTKCWTNGPELLIKASSSDPLAQLNAYRPDGSLIGQVQNGGGSRYGGTAFGGQRSDPGEVTIKSSSGGSITVKTSPFQPEP